MLTRSVPIRFCPPLLIALLSACWVGTAAARGDAIWIGESSSNPIKADGVKVLALQGGSLQYQSLSGETMTKPLTVIQQISIDGEPSFDAAEDAYRNGQWAAAVNGYSAALQSSSKDWIKMRSAARLTAAAFRTRQFDQQVAGYLYLMLHDPAAAVRPNLNDADPATLPAAATALSQFPLASVAPAQQAAVLRLELAVARARGDSTQVEAALKQLVGLGAASPEETAAYTLAAARAALASDPAAAEQMIQSHRTLLSDPAQQVEALYLLAQAKDRLAKPDDTTALEDAAIAYVREFTFARDLPNQPHAADSLLRVGQIEQALHEPQLAGDVYRQVLQQFPHAAAATAARSALEQLPKNP